MSFLLMFEKNRFWEKLILIVFYYRVKIDFFKNPKQTLKNDIIFLTKTIGAFMSRKDKGMEKKKEKKTFTFYCLIESSQWQARNKKTFDQYCLKWCFPLKYSSLF